MKLNRVMMLPVVAMMVGSLALAGCSNESTATNEDESAATTADESAPGVTSDCVPAKPAVGAEAFAVRRGGRGHWGRGERGRGWGRGRRAWWRFW